MTMLKFENKLIKVELSKENVVPIGAKPLRDYFRVTDNYGTKVFSNYKEAYNYFRSIVDNEPLTAPNPFEVC